MTLSLAPIADLSIARRRLEEAETLEEVTELMDRAEITRLLARKVGLSADAQNDWAEYKLDAERKAGEMLVAMDLRSGRPKEKSLHGETISPCKDFRLSDLGIDYSQSHRWQRIAAIPQDTFDEYKSETRSKGKEITETGALRIAKEQQRQAKRDENRALVMDVTPVLEHVAGETYQTVVLDPPWDWGDEGDIDQYGRGRPVYDTWKLDDVAALPVAELAKANAHCYLWITNRSLPKGFGLLEAWGFRYVTMLTWTKPSIGMGNYYRGSTEHVLFGVRGSLPLLRRNAGTWFAAPRPGEHSAKPDAFYELVETCSPGPWLELFARRNRPGWVHWGEGS